MPDGSGGFSVNIHHLVSDSWTLGLVAKEVVRIYSSIIHHEEIDVSSISSYVDYISAEQEYRASDKFKKDKAYWDSVFENIPESAFLVKQIVCRLLFLKKGWSKLTLIVKTLIFRLLISLWDYMRFIQAVFPE